MDLVKKHLFNPISRKYTEGGKKKMSVWYETLFGAYKFFGRASIFQKMSFDVASALAELVATPSGVV
jgi:hypothetical protein